MIGYLLGQAFSVDDAGVVTIMVDGVGYDVATSQEPLIGPSVGLFIHTHVTDDAIALYGFESELRRSHFRKMISIAGVGPRSAMAVLRSMSHDEMARALKASDTKAFAAVVGIGKTTAQRIIEALRDV
jgi:Holliday junction DNA helicase RuvA